MYKYNMYKYGCPNIICRLIDMYIQRCACVDIHIQPDTPMYTLPSSSVRSFWIIFRKIRRLFHFLLLFWFRRVWSLRIIPRFLHFLLSADIVVGHFGHVGHAGYLYNWASLRRFVWRRILWFSQFSLEGTVRDLNVMWMVGEQLGSTMWCDVCVCASPCMNLYHLCVCVCGCLHLYEHTVDVPMKSLSVYT